MIRRKKYDQIPEVLYYADAFLISLKKNEIFQLTIPAKLQTYLSLSKPIISFASGITNNIVSESKSGYAVESDDVENLQKTIKSISKKNLAYLKEMGNNGNIYAHYNFSKKNLIEEFNKLMKEI